MNNEIVKKNVYLFLSIIFIILTFVGASLVITHKVRNAGYSVVPMVFALVFNMLYRNSKKAIDENKK